METVPLPPTALAQPEYSAFKRFFIRAEDGVREGKGNRSREAEKPEILSRLGARAQLSESSAHVEQELTFQKKKKKSVIVAHIRPVIRALFFI